MPTLLTPAEQMNKSNIEEQVAALHAEYVAAGKAVDLHLVYDVDPSNRRVSGELWIVGGEMIVEWIHRNSADVWLELYAMVRALRIFNAA